MGKAVDSTAREAVVLMHTQQRRRLLIIAAPMGKAADGTALGSSACAYTAALQAVSHRRSHKRGSGQHNM